MVDDELEAEGVALSSERSIDVSTSGARVWSDQSVNDSGWLMLADAAGGRTLLTDKPGSELNVVDDSGRVWQQHEGTVRVISPDGSEHSWPRGTVRALAGFNEWGSEHALVVLGAGPALPEPGPVETVTSVTGSLIVARKPMANTSLELCLSPRTMFTGTPCGHDPGRLSVQSNAKGEFTFENVPLGVYGLTFKEESGWGNATGFTIKLLAPAAKKSVGAIRLN